MFVAGRRVSLLVISHPARNEQPARYVTASVLGGRGPWLDDKTAWEGVRVVLGP